ncbi:39S ribosomal protein L43, mitochondrial [Merluccius polli]|uniref:39S ribosomal protein L43, mitochondrial n=1 Tax=Merluccius polli TaxID=89951 RepID=A0AA47MCT4_MERPO|nr:39S ribosomal protein L43, mitochondrial [Merluccius polli]
MTSRGTASRFLQSVLQNGVGRYVCQLKRISIIFSKNAQSSLGIRYDGCGEMGPYRGGHTLTIARISAQEFIEEGVVDYAKRNPGTCSVRVSQHLQDTKNNFKELASYLCAVNGNVREETVTSKTSKEIAELITKLTNQSGLDIIRLRKPFHTDSPSIQGQWHPFTNRPPSVGPIKPPTLEG